MGEVPLYPHGGVRPSRQKSSFLTQSTLGPNVVQIWSRYTLKFRGNEILGVRNQVRGLARSAHLPGRERVYVGMCVCVRERKSERERER